MTEEERARMAQLADSLDAAIAARPDLLASPIGFIAGAFLAAHRSAPDAFWAQVLAMQALLTGAVAFVAAGVGDPAGIIGALVPPAS